MMIQGAGIGGGLAVGPVVKMSKPLPAPADLPPAGAVATEIERFSRAVEVVAAQLRSRATQAGGTAAEVLEAQALIIEDPTLADDVVAKIKGGKSADRAVYEGIAGFRQLLLGMGEYMAERASDLDDLSQRLIAELAGVGAPGVPESDFPFVLVAYDLAPADTALLDLSKVLALVTESGGPTSHTAILAREKSITAIVGASGVLTIDDGAMVIVDAAHGTVVAGASRVEIESARREATLRSIASLDVEGPGALADGTPLPLLANLGSAGDAAGARERGAEGVGLFRTEFLYLDASEAPSVAEQQEKYRQVLAAFDGCKIVVRALDAGADKPLSFLSMGEEENPALGVRGLRALRSNEAILRDQLTALANARTQTGAELWVMAPMVSTVEEAQYFTALAHELGLPQAGIMIEVPSAALLADQIMPVVDFVSIGTNDLTQYTMAADRMLGALATLQDPWHPAVLRLIAEIGRAGAAHGKPVGVCGEAAADPELAIVLVGLGATSLSMSSSALGAVRAALAEVTLEEARNLARVAVAAPGAREARAAVREARSMTSVVR